MPFLFLKEDLHVFLHDLAGCKRLQTVLVYDSYTVAYIVD
jgi:hypothetical protein